MLIPHRAPPADQLIDKVSKGWREAQISIRVHVAECHRMKSKKLWNTWKSKFPREKIGEQTCIQGGKKHPATEKCPSPVLRMAVTEFLFPICQSRRCWPQLNTCTLKERTLHSRTHKSRTHKVISNLIANKALE